MHRFTRCKILASQKELREPQTWVGIAAHLNREPLANPAQTGDGRQLALGLSIFHEQCAGCHRGDARGDEAGFSDQDMRALARWLAANLPFGVLRV